MRIYTVKSGDTLSGIAREFGVSMEEVISDNQIANPDRIVVGQAIVIRTSSTTIYTVRRGDTLASIAAMFGVSVQALLKANPSIFNPDLIFTHQEIIIPVAPTPNKSIRTNGYCYTNIDRNVLSSTLPYLTYISPFSYEVRADGSLSSLNDTSVIAASKEQSVSPLMVITNYDERTGGFSSDIAAAVLGSIPVQNTLLNNIVAVMKCKGHTGLDVDFEYVRRADKEKYNAFLERAVAKLHPLGYTVSTALPAIEYEGQPGLLYEGMDFEAHGRIVDWSLIMTYDWGYRYGPPMAVAPINRVERALQYAMSKIPRGKILMGIPNYGYDWILPHETGRPASLIMNIAAVTLAGRHWSEIKFDETAQAPYFNYRDDQGRNRVVWFDDARSFKAKFQLIEKYELRGLGYWNINTLFYPGWLVLGDMFRVEKVR